MFTCPDVLIQLPSGPFSFTHTHIHTHTGSLDRCVEGETAQTILNNSPLSSPAPSPSSSSSTPLQVCSLRAGEKDPMIQVLLFDPQSLITRLTKMEVEKVPKQRKPKQVDAFKTYLYARRHFGSESCLFASDYPDFPCSIALLPHPTASHTKYGSIHTNKATFILPCCSIKVLSY